MIWPRPHFAWFDWTGLVVAGISSAWLLTFRFVVQPFFEECWRRIGSAMPAPTQAVIDGAPLALGVLGLVPFFLISEHEPKGPRRYVIAATSSIAPVCLLLCFAAMCLPNYSLWGTLWWCPPD